MLQKEKRFAKKYWFTWERNWPHCKEATLPFNSTMHASRWPGSLAAPLYNVTLQVSLGKKLFWSYDLTITKWLKDQFTCTRLPALDHTSRGPVLGRTLALRRSAWSPRPLEGTINNCSTSIFNLSSDQCFTFGRQGLVVREGVEAVEEDPVVGHLLLRLLANHLDKVYSELRRQTKRLHLHLFCIFKTGRLLRQVLALLLLIIGLNLHNEDGKADWSQIHISVTKYIFWSSAFWVSHFLGQLSPKKVGSGGWWWAGWDGWGGRHGLLIGLTSWEPTRWRRRRAAKTTLDPNPPIFIATTHPNNQENYIWKKTKCFGILQEDWLNVHQSQQTEQFKASISGGWFCENEPTLAGISNSSHDAKAHYYFLEHLDLQ